MILEVYRNYGRIFLEWLVYVDGLFVLHAYLFIIIIIIIITRTKTTTITTITLFAKRNYLMMAKHQSMTHNNPE